MKTQRWIYIVLALIIQGLPACTQEQTSKNDWPQWMGPSRDAKWDPGLELDTISDSNFTKLWETSIGSGYCGPSVAGGKVYVMDYYRDEHEYERVLCFNLESGQKIWEYSYGVEYSIGYPTGPRASVLINEGKAYAFGTMGDLHCLDASSGKLIWHRDGNLEYKIDMPIWGMAASPLIEDDLLIVHMGGTEGACVIGLDIHNGKEVWRALDDPASYSAPIVIDQAGKRVLIVWTGDNVRGLDPSSGKIYWTIPFERTKSIINISTPVYEPPHLFLSSFYEGSMLIELDQDEPEAKLLWKRKGQNERRTDALHSIMSTPFIRGDYVYGVDSYGEFRCLDLLSGDRIWTDSTLTPYGRWSNAHFAFQKDKFWAFNEKGDLVLGMVDPDSFTDLGRVHLIDPVTISPNPRGGINWAFPAFASNRIIVRSDAKLIAYKIKEGVRRHPPDSAQSNALTQGKALPTGIPP